MGFGHPVEVLEQGQQARHLLQGNHVGAVRRGFVGIGVGFDEHPGQPYRHGGAAKRRSPPEEVPWPPGCCTEWVASNTTG